MEMRKEQKGPAAAGARRGPLFNWRAFISVTTAAAFLAMVISGVVLFITPPGRIANWTGWTIWSVTKEEWGGLHIWFSVIFVTASFLHLYLNWRSFVSYFRGKMRRALALRVEWAVALLLCVGGGGATLGKVKPFSSFLAWQEGIKNSWETPAKRSPVPHAELLSLSALAKTMEGISADAMMKNLRAAGIEVASAEAVLGDLAKKAGRPAIQVFEIATGQSGGGGSGGGGGGMGQMTLEQYCGQMNMKVEDAIQKLRARGFKAEGGMTMREIAVSGGVMPPALRGILAE
jgi:hypothetical protein